MTSRDTFTPEPLINGSGSHVPLQKTLRVLLFLVDQYRLTALVYDSVKTEKTLFGILKDLTP